MSEFSEIDLLLNKALSQNDPLPDNFSLREKFEKRILDLNITPHLVQKILGIQYRALEGILDGTQKRIDFSTLPKLASFLGISNSDLIQLYLKTIEKNHQPEIEKANIRSFISENFDLVSLKKIGVIDTLSDFDKIQDQLTNVLSAENIYDFNRNSINPAYSSVSLKPNNSRIRSFFTGKANRIFQKINNQNDYSREALIEYFPKIRWHSTDIEHGLITVMQSLFGLGITVIYQPKIPGLKIRGATFAVNDKPCIVLTNYRGFYPTLWFALLHELHHILFDWPEIMKNKYHLSDEGDDYLVFRQKEVEADEFARDYMFPKNKMETIKDRIGKPIFIRQFAYENHIHESIIYAYFAFEYNSIEQNLWARFNNKMPNIDNLLNSLGNGLGHKGTANEYAIYYFKILNPID